MINLNRESIPGQSVPLAVSLKAFPIGLFVSDIELIQLFLIESLVPKRKLKCFECVRTSELLSRESAFCKNNRRHKEVLSRES